MTSTENSNLCAARRKAVSACVAALCCDAGFHEADKVALETLTEMLQSYISELGRSARAFCELSGRTQPMLNDVTVALIEMGTDLPGLTMHAKKTQRVLIQPQEQMRTPVTPRILQAGERKAHPFHIPDYLPPFPDPHTYIKTPSYRRPENEYEAIREKAASQRRHVERALTRFVAKTGDTHTLFPDDNSTFPLIACQPAAVPYLDALLPLEHESDPVDDDPSEPTDSDKQTDSQDNDTQDEKELKEDSPGRSNADNSVSASQQMNERTQEVSIDNPYLRPVKKPKVKRKLKS